MSDFSYFTDPTDSLRIDLDLPGNPWIEIKRELSFSEEQALAGAMMGGFRAEGKKGDAQTAEVALNTERYAVEKLFVWLLNWSFVRDGKSVRITRDAIKNLKPFVAEAIGAAIDAHSDASEQEKKVPTSRN